MAVAGRDWYSGLPGSTPDAAAECHPRALAFKVEFPGLGVQVWSTETGVNSGDSLFSSDEQPLVGVTITSRNDRRTFSEIGNHGVVIREGYQNADEQWHYRVFWDATVSAWSVIVVFGGSLTDPAGPGAGTAIEQPHDDGAVRSATIVMIGPDASY